jgi:hypothetical protein
MLVEANVFSCALELLQSSHSNILRATCNMLESIARYEELKITITEVELCKEMTSLFGFVLPIS